MERYALPVAFLVMEAGWAAGAGTVAAARLSPGQPILSLPLALLTLCVAYMVGSRLLQRDLEDADDEPTRRRAAIPLAALALGLCWTIGAVWLTRHWGEEATWIESLPTALTGAAPSSAADAIALLAVFGLWWRGQRAGAVPPEHETTVRAFGTGALVLAASLLLGAGLRAESAALSACIVCFLGGGLPALSLARLQEVRRDLAAGAARGEPARLDAAWWRTLLPPVLAVLACAALAAFVFGDPTWRGAMSHALRQVGDALIALLYWPVFALGLIAEWLILILRALRRPQAQVEREAPTANEAEQLLENLRRRDVRPAEWLSVLPWVGGALAVILIVFAFLATSRAVRRAAREPSAAYPERQPVGGWGLLLADLRAALRALLRHLRSRGASLAATLPVPTAWRPRTAAPAIDDARAAYRALLALGREQSVPRRPQETPDEYLVTWSQALPAETEAAELTGVYRAARYGPPSLSLDPLGEPARLRQLLVRIRELLRFSGRGR